MRPLLAVSAVSSALVLGAALRGGPLLMRDAVSTPRSYLTDAALGLGDAPARRGPARWLACDGQCGSAGDPRPHRDDVDLVGARRTRCRGLGVAARSRLGASVCRGAGRGVEPVGGGAVDAGQWSLIAGYAAIPWVLVAAQRIWSDERVGGRCCGLRSSVPV